MKMTLRRLTSLVIAFALLVSLCPISGNAANDELNSADKGIPLLIIHIDENAGGDYKTIAEMNASPKHTVTCDGTVEIKVPDGYKSLYGDYTVPTEPIKLDFIRGRGNTTWLADKKPYKLKFEKKQDLFGMGASKNWELIANAFDPSLLKNRITYWLGDQLGMNYTPQTVPVEVVMEGANSREYLGTYCLSEGVKVEKSRVAIDELKKEDGDASGDSNITGGYLLSYYAEAQNDDEPESNIFTTKGGLTLINDTPSYASEDALTAGEKVQRAYIRDYVQQVEDLILENDTIDATTHQRIADLMDMQSAADYWWINEFARNGDAYGTDSTFLYKEKNGKLFWGPLWDYDFAWGSPEYEENTDPEKPSGFNQTDSLWLNALREKDSEFRKLIIERWKVFDKALTELTRDGGIIDQFANEVALAQKADYTKWKAVNKDYPGVEDYSRVVNNLKASIIDRQKTANKYIEQVPNVYATLNYEVDGEIFYTEKQPMWNCGDEPDKYPVKEGYVFKDWVEKESKKSIGEYYIVGDTTCVPTYVKESEAVLPKKLYLAKYEDWLPYPYESETYTIETEVYPEEATCQILTVTSSNEKVATVVKRSQVKINGVGDTTITLKTHNGVKREFKLHVYDEKTAKLTNATNVKVTKNLITMKKSDRIQPSYTISPKGMLAECSVGFRSDNTDIVDQSYCGVLLPKKNGNTVVKCILFDKDYNAIDEDVFIVNVGEKGTKKNTLSVKAKAVSLSAKKLSSKKMTVKVGKTLKVTKAKGSMTYAIDSVSNKSAASKIKINSSTGKITVAKGLKKGTYKVKILANASGNKTYAPALKTVTVKLTVK